MRGIQKRKTSEGIRYQVQIRMKGYRTLSKTFKRKTDAVRWKQQTEADIHRQIIFPECEAERRTLTELVDRYLEDCLGNLKSRNGTKQTLKWWKQRIGYLTLNRISPALIKQEWETLSEGNSKLTGRPLTNRTLNGYLQSLSTAFTIAIKEYGWAQINPVSNIRKKSLPNGRTRFLSKEELKSLFTQIDKSTNPYLKPAVLLSLATGGRRGEIMNLQWKDVDLKEGYLTFRQTKNGETRTVPVRGEALEELKRHAQKYRFSSEYLFESRKPKWKKGLATTGKAWEDLHNPFREVVKNAKIDDFRWHDMRHCAASYLLASGATLAQVGKILGHKTPAMTWRYSHLVKDKSDQLVSDMNEKFLAI